MGPVEVHSTNLIAGALLILLGVSFIAFQGSSALSGVYADLGLDEVGFRAQLWVSDVAQDTPEAAVAAGALMAIGGIWLWRRRGLGAVGVDQLREVLGKPADWASKEASESPAARLEVYVSANCFGCAEARELASAAARRFPGLAVRVMDLERQPEVRPDSLVAVPSYLLDGRLVWLGNPRQQDLFGHLELAMARRLEQGWGEP
jgi:hypothetical protein